MADFVVGGAVPVDSPAHVPRAFEDECFRELTAGNWVLLLGPRQHGKSSGLYRLRVRLDENGFRTALIDFQSFGAPDDYPSLLRWFSARIAAAFGSVFAEPVLAAREDLEAWLVCNQPPGFGSLAILIDEAGAVPPAWQNRFFSQLRALYNTRAAAEAHSFARRTVFLFAGTFRPERLVNEDNSPFNVSRDVKSRDLTRDEVIELAERVYGSDELAGWAERAHELAGGQPYLLQLLLAAVAAGADDAEREQLFETAVGELNHGSDRHFASLFEKVFAEQRLTELVAEIAAREDGIPFNAGDADHSFLEVLGAGRLEDGCLVIRNEIYRQLVLKNPQFSPGRDAQEADSVLLAAGEPAFDAISDDRLRQFASENFAGAVRAHNAGNHRLALAGFGSVVEAILLDHLSALTVPDLDTARQAVDPPRPGGRVAGWSLFDTIRVAAKTIPLQHTNMEPAQALRDWRNLVHPALAVVDFLGDEALRPEARMGAEVIHVILRDLGRA